MSEITTVDNSISISDLEKRITKLEKLLKEEYVTNDYLIRALTNYVADSELADVAKTGLYDDLKNKPVIPGVKEN